MRGMKHINKEPLTVEERACMANLLWHPSPQLNPTNKPRISSWKIRMSNEELQNWWTKIESSTFFFDGASKGNLGIEGTGGVIFESKGNK